MPGLFSPTVGMKKRYKNFIDKRQHKKAEASRVEAALKERPVGGFADLAKIISGDNNLAKLRTLRSTSQAYLKKEMHRAPKKKAGLPSTVQEHICQWDNKNIKILGIRSGWANINSETVKEIKQVMEKPNQKVFIQDNLKSILSKEGLEIGATIRQRPEYIAKIGGSRVYQAAARAFAAIIPLVQRVIWTCGKTARRFLGYPMRPELYPSFDKQKQYRVKHLPENIEWDALRVLGKNNDAKKVDQNSMARFINQSSAFMAGMLVKLVWREEKSDDDIVFICNGVYMPRIVTCLSAQTISSIPDGVFKDFRRGFRTDLPRSL